MDIDALEGRELDAAVAEVRGWRVPTDHDCTDPHCDCIDWYHRDIAAAWELDEEGWLWEFTEHPHYLWVNLWTTRIAWSVRFSHMRPGEVFSTKVYWTYVGNRAEAYAHARCILYLKAKASD